MPVRVRKKLTERQRIALSLWDEGLSCADIARRLGISRQGAYLLVRRAWESAGRKGRLPRRPPIPPHHPLYPLVLRFGTVGALALAARIDPHRVGKWIRGTRPQREVAERVLDLARRVAPEAVPGLQRWVESYGSLGDQAATLTIRLPVAALDGLARPSVAVREALLRALSDLRAGVVPQPRASRGGLRVTLTTRMHREAADELRRLAKRAGWTVSALAEHYLLSESVRGAK